MIWRQSRFLLFFQGDRGGAVSEGIRGGPSGGHEYTWRNFRIFAKAKIRVQNLFSREILGEISHFIMPIFWFTVLFFER